MFMLSLCKEFKNLFLLVLGYSILSSFKKFATDILKDDSFISLAGAIGAFFGGIRF